MIQSFLFNCGLGSANFIFFFFFKNNSIYLFLAVLGRRCGEGFSLVAASEDDSLVAVLGFSRRRSQALGTWVSVVVAPELQSTESVVVAHRLCSSMACGIFPDQGLNLCLWHRQVDSSPLSHQESTPLSFFWPHCVTCRILAPRPGIEPVYPAMDL